MRIIKAGIIGCGGISDIFFKNYTKRFEVLNIVACSDLSLEKSQAQAKKYNIPKAYTTEEMLKDPEIELVINLTSAQAHYAINMACLEAGKHVYCEKPLAVTKEQGKKLVEKAAEKSLLLGSAPDTFMGAGLQTCRNR
jgi:predicted dehydrogenase